MDTPDALLAAATRHTTPCGSGTLVWHRWGPARGAPVVLLHGGSGSWTHWLRNIAPLAAAGHAVWVPDMPGFGASARPPDGEDAEVLPGWPPIACHRWTFARGMPCRPARCAWRRTATTCCS